MGIFGRNRRFLKPVVILANLDVLNIRDTSDGGGTARKDTVVYDRKGRHGSFVDGVVGARKISALIV